MSNLSEKIASEHKPERDWSSENTGYWCSCDPGRGFFADDGVDPITLFVDHIAEVTEAALQGRVDNRDEWEYPPEILSMAEAFGGACEGDEVTGIQVLLMRAWGENDASCSVSQYPASYVETFRDMAKAIVKDRSAITEAATREQVAREIADYCDAALELIDSNNGARLAFEMILTIARGGES